MIEQVSNALTFLAHFVASGSAATGLTVTCTVYKASTGAAVVTSQAATEIGGGLYKYTLASGSVDAEDNYVAVFTTAGTADQKSIPALWVVGKSGVENLDATIASRNATTPPTAAAIADQVWDEAIAGHTSAGSTGAALSIAGSASDPLTNAVPGSYESGTAGHALGRIGAATVEVSGPVLPNRTVSIVRGDTYTTALGRSLQWSSDSWPSLAGATITLSVRSALDVLLLTKAGSASGSTVTVELTAAQSALVTGQHRYDVQATISGAIVTLVSGAFVVLGDETR